MSPFDEIRQSDDSGQEYWSARDLSKLLGYSGWQRFKEAIERARTACVKSGQDVGNHFNNDVKVVALGSGARRSIDDYHLSRYACYLIIQNADPNKPIVAMGQTYFAVQTRRQEQADALAGLSEAQRRLLLRDQLSDHNRQLAGTAQAAGVVTAMDFALFQDHGYRGLYAGESARDIHRRKGLKRSQHILDHMGAEELAANLFRSTQAEARIRREEVQGKEAANQTHYEAGQVVRRAIAEMGGTMPEDLPTPSESVHQVRRREERRQIQPPLFE